MTTRTRASRPLAARAGAGGAVLHHLADVDAGGAHRDQGAERGDGQRDEGGAAEDGDPIGVPDPPEGEVGLDVGAGPAGDRVEPPRRARRAEDAAGEAEQRALPHALHDEARRGGAQREPDRGLADPLVGARGEQRGGVDDRQQQDQPRGQR